MEDIYGWKTKDRNSITYAETGFKKSHERATRNTINVVWCYIKIMNGSLDVM